MTIFAEVIKNLYIKGNISSNKVYEFFQSGKLTREEYLTILGKDEK